jgi:hypothetical protein
MFVNNQAGALAAAHYYLEARNWTLASLDARTFQIICDASKCKRDTTIYSTIKSRRQHVQGARAKFQAPSVLVAPKVSSAQWVVRVSVSLGRGAILNSKNQLVERQSASTQSLDLYARWSGRMWRISDVFLAG